jgi:hypothetical protein
MKKIIKRSLLAIFIPLLLTSCYSTYSVYKGNVHEQAVGKTKNEILRSYGVPNQIISDGAGGEVLVYENYTQTTVTSTNSDTKGGSSSIAGLTYRRNGAVIQSETKGGSSTSTRTVSQTSLNKTFCNLYVGPDNVIYDYNTNYGAEYNYFSCFNRKKTWIAVGVSCLAIWPAFITVPWAIIAQKKAKKNSVICD